MHLGLNFCDLPVDIHENSKIQVPQKLYEYMLYTYVKIFCAKFDIF